MGDRFEAADYINSILPDIAVDPAANASGEEKAAAFEWLRNVSVSDSPQAEPAAVLLYEIVRMNMKIEELNERLLG